jgi:hypothetical protein
MLVLMAMPEEYVATSRLILGREVSIMLIELFF